MVSIATTMFCIISLFISMVLPILILILLAVKNKKQGILSAWFLGAAGFVVTQLLIRVPILTALQGQSWFVAFSQNHLFLYAFSLALTAGLFELAGRFGVAKFMQKNLTCKRALAAGLGHGGIEAILLVGITYINNLVYISLINSGGFDALIAQSAALGVDTTQLYAIQDTLLNSPSLIFLLGGFERILAMISHVAMSMLVSYGVAKKKTAPCVLICLVIHTFLDLTAGISLLIGSVLSQATAYFLIYSILTAVAVFSLYVIRELCRRWTETEVSHDSEK